MQLILVRVVQLIVIGAVGSNSLEGIRKHYAQVVGKWPILLIIQQHLCGSFFLHLQNFFYTSKLFLNSQKTLWPFKKIHRYHTSKIMSTFESQNIWLPKVKIYHRKSIFESQKWLPEVKMYHRKSTSRIQKIFDFQEVKEKFSDFRKVIFFFFEYF